jgi:hypothetical protein
MYSFGPAASPGYTVDPPTTGRRLVLLRESGDGITASATAALSDRAGLEVSVASTASESDTAATLAATAEPNQAVIFERLGVAVVNGDSDQATALRVAAADPALPVEAVEDEQYVFATDAFPSLGTPPVILAGGGTSEFAVRYMQGFRDAVLALTEPLLGPAPGGPVPPLVPPAQALLALNEATNT